MWNTIYKTTYINRLPWHSVTTLTEVFPWFSSVVRQMPGLNSQSRGTYRISSEYCLLCCACHCVMLLSLCCSVVIMLYCYCVALLLFVLSYVLIVCTVPLPPGVNPIAVDKYIRISECSLSEFPPKLVIIGMFRIKLYFVRNQVLRHQGYCLFTAPRSLKSSNRGHRAQLCNGT